MTLKTKLEAVFGDDERAVSPVIGVILMVAITVILAAVIATFVLELGSDQNAAPSASFQFDYDGTNVIITHNGGDAVNDKNLDIVIAGTSNNWGTSGNDVTAGQTKSLTASSGNSVSVVWVNPETDKSTTLATYEVP